MAGSAAPPEIDSGDRPLGERGQPSLYDLLEVAPGADPAVIRAAYCVLARNYHPDISRDLKAGQRMREINTAYDVLSDPVRRAQYDADRARAARARGGRERAGGSTGGRAARAPSPPATYRPAVLGARIAVGMAVILLLVATVWAISLVFDLLDDVPPPVTPRDHGIPALSRVAPAGGFPAAPTAASVAHDGDASAYPGVVWLR